MTIIEPVIRPPSEAGSFLLQITTGCSSNHCTFCGAYAGKPFVVKDAAEIKEDIAVWASRFPGTRRVFLMDGDALVVKNDRLLPILKELRTAFPKLTRISSYANGYNITTRSTEELKELFEHKIKVIYIGLESGSQQVLDLCKKRSTAVEMVEAVKRAQDAGIKASVIVLLGLGGKVLSKEHVQNTIKALNRMQPRYLSFLSLMLIPGTPAYTEAQEGRFEELNSKELLREMYDIIKELDLEKTIFRSNHASNFLALEGVFPKDKETILNALDHALEGEIGLKPDFLRGL